MNRVQKSTSQRLKLAVLVLLVLLTGMAGWWALHDLPTATGAPAAPRGPGDAPGELAKRPLRVLFVGNSYTFVNDTQVTRKVMLAIQLRRHPQPTPPCSVKVSEGKVEVKPSKKEERASAEQRGGG